MPLLQALGSHGAYKSYKPWIGEGLIAVVWDGLVLMAGGLGYRL